MIAPNESHGSCAADSAADPRTEAQREAAQRNGSHSRGPTTAEGRARAAQNSVRHGIFARIVPTSDPRGDDKTYEQIHEELLREFAPKTFSQRALVVHLATKHLQLLRVVAMIEQVQAPRLNDDDLSNWRKAQEVREELALVEHVLGRPRAEPYYYAPGEAERLARTVVSLARGILEVLAESEGPDAIPEGEQRPDELAELYELRRLAALINGAKRRLHDHADLVALFRGDRRPRRGELTRLLSLLQHAAVNLRGSLYLSEQRTQRVEHAAMRSTQASSDRLDELERLEEYRHRLERAIERQTQQLRG